MLTMLPPGPSLPTPIQTLIWVRRPTEFLTECRRRYGNVFTLRLPQGPIVLVSEPEHVKTIFTGDPEQLRAGEVNLIIGPVVGEHSVLTLDGKQHLRQRKMMLPSFHGERMRLYARTMQEITERTLETWPVNEPFSLHPHMQHITLEVILRTVFGVDEGAQLEELRDRLRELLSVSQSPFSALMIVPALRRDFAGLTPWRRFVRNLGLTNDLIYREIARRRSQPDATAHRTDVLSLLLAARDENGRPLGDVELRDELVTLLIAGHETTATALCWAFERVLATPRVLDRLGAEVDRVRGMSLPEQLGRLEYLDATITEALRLRPVIPMVGRKLHAPLRIGQWELPPGTIVAPSIYLTHRSAAYPEPEEFRPERFVGTRPDPYAWFPFGGGIRRCLGMAFALYEMKVVMATVLSHVSLSLAQPAPARIVRRSITFSPERGTMVTSRPRFQRAVA